MSQETLEIYLREKSLIPDCNTLAYRKGKELYIRWLYIRSLALFTKGPSAPMNNNFDRGHRVEKTRFFGQNCPKND